MKLIDGNGEFEKFSDACRSFAINFQNSSDLAWNVVHNLFWKIMFNLSIINIY